MLIQIQSIQIPKFWEVIKFAALNSDDIKEDFVNVYSINLLHDLLSRKKYCYLAQENNQILFVVILEFRVDKIIDMPYVYFNNLYSFKPQNMDIWKEVFFDLRKIAVVNKCKAIIGESSNFRVGEINDLVGASCIAKKYAYYL